MYHGTPQRGAIVFELYSAISDGVVLMLSFGVSKLGQLKWSIHSFVSHAKHHTSTLYVVGSTPSGAEQVDAVAVLPRNHYEYAGDADVSASSTMKILGQVFISSAVRNERSSHSQAVIMLLCIKSWPPLVLSGRLRVLAAEHAHASAAYCCCAPTHVSLPVQLLTSSSHPTCMQDNECRVYLSVGNGPF
jgi:hypothetical protein